MNVVIIMTFIEKNKYCKYINYLNLCDWSLNCMIIELLNYIFYISNYISISLILFINILYTESVLVMHTNTQAI